MTAASNSQMPSHGDHRRGVFLVLLAGGFWSIVGLVVRLIDDASVWQILFYRSLALTLFLLVVISLKTRGRPMAAFRKAGSSAALGGLALSLAFFGSIAALQNTSVANAMFLFASAPFLTALLALPLLGERPRKATLIAMVFAALGVAVMVAEGISLGNGLGNVYAGLSALGFALFTIALRHGRGEDMLPAVCLAGLFSSVIAAGVCVVTGDGIAVTADDALLSCGLGVVQLGFGLTLYTLGSKVVPAGELALLSMTEVVLGPIWVWLILGEGASPWTLLGGGILLAAIAGNAVTQLRHRPSPLPI
ncbi:MAG TPA: DMT family transporter [Kiloniellaceae bacterium]|nr:DMT family transporter [Kiloniellaceae bacterium]